MTIMISMSLLMSYW